MEDQAGEIAAVAQDRDWLGQATKALAKFWLGKNQRKGAPLLRSVSPEVDGGKAA